MPRAGRDRWPYRAAGSATTLRLMRPAHLRTALVAAAVLALSACAGGATTAPSPTLDASAEPSPAATSASSTPSPVPTPAPAADLQAVLDAVRRDYGAPGALAVLVRDGERTFAASGTADIDGTPITEATRFRIASITKPIVAALVLDAVDRGEVALDDVVGEILPGVIRPNPPITVRQLLDHTSGIFDEGNDGDPTADIAKLTDPALKAEAEDLARRYTAGERIIAPDRVLVGLAETHERYFSPGDGYHYSNTGYQLAGMILEEVTGQPLADLLRARIVEPLGLERTTIAPPDTGSPEMRGYVTSTDDGSLVDLTDDLLAFGNGGNGGVISTADELLTTMQAIAGGRLLPADLVAEMKEPNRELYGLGLGTSRLRCGTFYGHGGLVNGTASIALVSPDGADGVVMALNLQSDDDPHLPALADILLCKGR